MSLAVVALISPGPDSSCVPIRLFLLFHSCHWLTTQLLFVFVTVLAQSFLTLVRRHLVAFAFLSVRHIKK
jgi:hypothetical protein